MTVSSTRWLDSVRAVAPDWAGAFAAVPREWFVPGTVWRKNLDGRGWLPVHRATEPDTWSQLVEADQFVVTQVDDGQPELPGGLGRAVTSSTSMPTVMAVMLHALALDPTRAAAKVLEIGTGTGWNTALLAQRVGAGNVVSIEVDPLLAEHAGGRLAAAGYPAATVITGDGELGWPDRAPYDRVLCTAGCHQIPHAWVRQTRPGGLIITPWETPYLASALLALTVTDDATASGHFIDHASFMSLRGQRVGNWIANPSAKVRAAESATTLHPYEPVSDRDGAAFAVSLLVPGIEKNIVFDDPHTQRTYEVLIYDEQTRSWATVNVTPEARAAGAYPVRQHGPRRLWDEIETAHTWWQEHGRPAYTEFGLTVGPAGQHAWLRDPTQRLEAMTLPATA